MKIKRLILIKKGVLTSLKNRLIFTIVLVSIISLTAMILVSYIALHSLEKDKIENYVNTSLLQLTEQMSQSYYNMIRIAGQMNIEGAVGSIVDTYLTEQNKYEIYHKRNLIRNGLLNIEFPNSYVNYIAYYDPITESSLFDENKLDSDSNLFDLPVLAKIGTTVYHGIHLSNRAFNQKEVISLIQPVRFSNGQELYIYIEMKINTNDYTNYDGRDMIINSEAISFLQVDEYEKVRYSNNSSFSYNDFFDVAHILENNNNVAEIGDYYAIAQQSSFHFTNVMLIPSKEYKNEINIWIQRIFIISFTSIVLFTIAAFMIYRLIYRPINLFKEELIKVGKGHFETDEYNFGVSEFDSLFRQFNEMKLQVKQLMIDVQESEAQKKQLKIETLMYQINPHFLVNTINSAKWLASMHHANDLSTFLSEMNAILIYKLGKGVHSTTFRTEIEILEKYIYIQKMRYDFSVDIQVEKGDYLDYPTVKLLLQPLVENALQYGISNNGKISINIFFSKEKQCIVVTIEDNGPGMTIEKLNELNKPFRYQDEGSIQNNGIGLRYVRAMLYEYYGDKASLVISSSPEKGTKVSIFIAESI